MSREKKPASGGQDRIREEDAAKKDPRDREEQPRKEREGAPGKDGPREEPAASETDKEEIRAGEQETEAGKQEQPEEDPLETKYLRLMADFQNYKKRVDKEKADIYAYANEKIILDLLDVIDNYERAFSHQGEEETAIREGMAKIYKQFQGVLEKNGVCEIEALGQDFDPMLHNAVMTEQTGEYAAGKVSCVLQKGYLLNNKVIRHTMVKVAE